MNRAPYGIAPVVPVVGMAATVCIGSDTYAAEVSAVIPARGRRALTLQIRMVGDCSYGLDSYVPSRVQHGVYDGPNGRRAYLGAARTYRDPSI